MHRSYPRSQDDPPGEPEGSYDPFDTPQSPSWMNSARSWLRDHRWRLMLSALLVAIETVGITTTAITTGPGDPGYSTTISAGESIVQIVVFLAFFAVAITALALWAPIELLLALAVTHLLYWSDVLPVDKVGAMIAMPPILAVPFALVFAILRHGGEWLFWTTIGGNDSLNNRSNHRPGEH